MAGSRSWCAVETCGGACACAPQAFARFMLRLVQRGGGGRIKQLGGGLQPLLIEFAEACRVLLFQPPLTTAEADALNDVS